MNPSNNWLSTTSNPVGQQLLVAGKKLMQSIYDYHSPSPDYLPTSYQMNGQTSKLTDYKWHIENSNTAIFWENVPPSNYAWLCDNDKVLQSDFMATNPSHAGYIALTDCSGFIAGLLAYCNGVGGIKTHFTQWKKGEDILNAHQYRQFFTDSNNADFKLIETINQVAPGDFIAFGYHTQGHENTGHIMLIVATRKVNDYQTEVVIMDESSGIHSEDTRLVMKNGKPLIQNGKHVKVRGIGMGKSLLGMVIKDATGSVVPFTGAEGQNAEKAFMGFYWGDGVNHTLEYPVAVGRANGIHVTT